MPETNTKNEANDRTKYGFYLVIIGLVVILVVFVVAVRKYTTANDVVTVIGSVTGVIGTIVGAFFGVQVGAAGKEKAETARRDAEERALKLASAMQPEVATKILGMHL
jgi:Na+/H+ antiporter NhaC